MKKAKAKIIASHVERKVEGGVAVPLEGQAMFRQDGSTSAKYFQSNLYD